MELTLPITVYWDLAQDTPLDDNLLQICDSIVECRPLMLQLYDSSDLPGKAVKAILERFKNTPIAVILTIPYSQLTSLAETSNEELGVKELLIACENGAFLESLHSVPDVGLSFFVNRSNWHELPEIVSFCRNRTSKRLVLPMQRLYNGEEPFFLNKSEQSVLEDALAAIGGSSELRLTIHDPFLWRAFNPGIPFPQGGCQAANTMIAISPDGGVYPCPTLPERLGYIGAASLKEIITSPAKKDLRSRIVRFPDACSSCLEIAVCRGGCRGRSYVAHGSFNAIDDACQ
jgi:GeoRSP system SPASM domain protein